MKTHAGTWLRRACALALCALACALGAPARGEGTALRDACAPGGFAARLVREGGAEIPDGGVFHIGEALRVRLECALDASALREGDLWTLRLPEGLCAVQTDGPDALGGATVRAADGGREIVVRAGRGAAEAEGGTYALTAEAGVTLGRVPGDGGRRTYSLDGAHETRLLLAPNVRSAKRALEDAGEYALVFTSDMALQRATITDAPPQGALALADSVAVYANGLPARFTARLDGAALTIALTDGARADEEIVATYRVQPDGAGEMRDAGQATLSYALSNGLSGQAYTGAPLPRNEAWTAAFRARVAAAGVSLTSAPTVLPIAAPSAAQVVVSLMETGTDVPTDAPSDTSTVLPIAVPSVAQATTLPTPAPIAAQMVVLLTEAGTDVPTDAPTDAPMVLPTPAPTAAQPSPSPTPTPTAAQPTASPTPTPTPSASPLILAPSPMPAQMDRTLEIRWEPPQAAPERVTALLYRKLAGDAAFPARPYLAAEVRGGDTGAWRFTFHGLACYNERGETYVYRVRQANADGCAPVYADDGFAITNVRAPGIGGSGAVAAPEGVALVDGDWLYVDAHGAPVGVAQLGGDARPALIPVAAALLALAIALAVALVRRRRR